MFAFIVTVQLPVPEHAPPQPENVYPELGMTMSTIVVPLFKVAEQVVPQEIAEGLLVTVPFAEVTDRLYVVLVPPPSPLLLAVKFAVTF